MQGLEGRQDLCVPNKVWPLIHHVSHKSFLVAQARSNTMADISYPAVIAAARAWFRLGDLRINMSGTENIPREGGALLAVNHVSYVDYIMAGYPGAQRGRLTR